MQNIKWILIIVLVSATLFISISIGGQTNANRKEVVTSASRTMTFQGILKNNFGEPVINDTLNIVFKIFDDPDYGYPLWADTIGIFTNSGGYFNAELENLNLPFNDDYWLELQVVGDLQEMLPRNKITISPYAANADTSDFSRNRPPDDDWMIDEDNIYYLNGNVGIGIESPDEKLQVTGIIHSMLGGFKFPDNSIQTSASSPINAIIDYGTSNNSGTTRQMSEIKICYGTVSIPPGNYTTITGLPFSSGSSYTVIVSRQTSTYAIQAVTTNILSGSAFEIHDFTYNSVVNWLAFGY